MMTSRARLVLSLVSGLACASNGQSADAPPEPPLQGPTVQLWLTTASGGKLLSQEPDIHFASGGAAGPTTITVDEATTYQEMAGLGAAITDASARLLPDGTSA